MLLYMPARYKRGECLIFEVASESANYVDTAHNAMYVASLMTSHFLLAEMSRFAAKSQFKVIS